MKCDELKVYKELEDYVGYGDIPTEMYDKAEVDKAIAELKAENSRLKRALWLAIAERAKNKKEEREANIRFLKSHKNKLTEGPIIGVLAEVVRWGKAERKCRAKVEAYK